MQNAAQLTRKTLGKLWCWIFEIHYSVLVLLHANR